MAVPKTKQNKSEYFAFGNPLLCSLVAVGFYFLGLTLSTPEHVPSVLGPVGEFLKTIGQKYTTPLIYLTVIAIVIHIFESIYAIYLCRKFGLSFGSTLKWCFQTMLFGFPSLRELKKFEERKKSPKKLK